MVTGLLRPTILIPAALDQSDQDPEPLRLSLLHEIAHAERSDHWFSTAAGMAQAIWFFIPQVWWIRSQLLIDQEFLADRAAAEHYGTSSEYASSLLSLAAPDARGAAAPARNSARDAPVAGTIGVQSPLFQRMMMLLHCPFPVESRTPRVWSWTSRLAVVVASIAAACLVIRWPQASLAVLAPPAAGSPRHLFEVDQFVAQPPQQAPGTERSLLYIIPVALPSHFDLDVEVFSSEADLPQIRIAGQGLGLARGSTTSGPSLPGPDSPHAIDASPAADWHRVHIHSDHHHVSVLVDGHAISTVSRNAASNWLTVEPPPHISVPFRNLMVTW